MKLFFDDTDFDAQLQRTAVKTLYRCADLGEILALAARIEPGDYESWFDGWSELANEVQAFADSEELKSHSANARDSYLRASEYFRTAYFFSRRDLTSRRLHAAFDASRAAFARAAGLMEHPCEAVAIPFEGTALTGWFLKPNDSDQPRPTILLPAGYDSPAEEGYSLGAVEAILRGYNCLIFVGPGQGSLLYEEGVPFRHDYEAVVTPVVGYLSSRPDVDPEQLVILGRSFGGYLAPRAAAYEHRLAAMVADPAQIDLGQNLRGRFPQEWLDLIDANDHSLDGAFWAANGGSRAHEFWGARLAAHGLNSPLAYFHEMERWKVPADQIQCPSWLSQGEGDFAGQDAQLLYDAITAPKRLRIFTAAEGSGGHCEGLGPSRFFAEVFSWLDDVLDAAR